MYLCCAGLGGGGSALPGEPEHQLHQGQRYLRLEKVSGAAQVPLHVWP